MYPKEYEYLISGGADDDDRAFFVLEVGEGADCEVLGLDSALGLEGAALGSEYLGDYFPPPL